MHRGFDEYASDYDAALERGISVSGESKEYFARNRIAWLSSRLAALRERPARIMDYGCGTGAAVPVLIDVFSAQSVVGLDISPRSLEQARLASPRATFLSCDEYVPQSSIDLVFCNGVFHHIRPQGRAAAVDYIYRSLRPGGVFALWENNPWNPGTRYVMSRIPFDRDTTPLSAPEARRLLGAGGFEILRTDYLFVFPRALAWLRPLEPPLSGVPLGAQYQVLCRRPG
jgi:SAM-dependent methyltransferase